MANQMPFVLSPLKNKYMKKAVIFDSWGVLQDGQGPNTALIEIVKILKEKGLLLFVLSNANETQAAENEPVTSTFKDLFTKFYYSFETGFHKPEPGAFTVILKENALSPEECVYFDDSMENVDAANSLGIESYFYTGHELVREKLTI